MWLGCLFRHHNRTPLRRECQGAFAPDATGTACDDRDATPKVPQIELFQIRCDRRHSEDVRIFRGDVCGKEEMDSFTLDGLVYLLGS